jgi:hypothetical protein
MPPQTSQSHDGGAKLAFDLIIVPLAAVLRLLGVDPMGLKRSSAPTYWKRRRKPCDMTSQF